MGDVTTCIYLGTHAVAETMDRLIDDGHDPEIPVAVVYHASWPDEDVLYGTIGTIGEKLDEAGYRASAMVIIGEAVTGAGYERSYLYDGWADRGPIVTAMTRVATRATTRQRRQTTVRTRTRRRQHNEHGQRIHDDEQRHERRLRQRRSL
jgi:Precorrin-4 methylase